MARKGAPESFVTKITRNDRFAQMSKQEEIIEQKKREIQARLEMKKVEQTSSSANDQKKSPSSQSTSNSKQKTTPKKIISPSSKLKQFNAFSNDGSFLDQFKALSEVKKVDKTPCKAERNNRDIQDKKHSDDRNNRGQSRWSKSHRSPSPKNPQKPRNSRFSDVPPQTYDSKSAEQQSFPPAFSSDLYSPTNPPAANPQPPPQMAQQPLLQNPPIVTFQQSVPQQNPSMLLPPPQMPLPISQIPSMPQINIPPPPCLELSQIPPPNPIPVHSIPQPEPINMLTIPPPAPLQLQNIPPPSPIQLNEIPNPKPIDLLNIPAPAEGKAPDFIKTVPPPNKAVPPPVIGPPVSASIPSLMEKPILPPMNRPPPLIQQPPPNILGIPGPPPLLTQPPPINFPNPALKIGESGVSPTTSQILGPLPETVNVEGSSSTEALVSLGRMVAQYGPGFEDIVRQRSQNDPNLWFLYNTQSPAYRQYRQLVDFFIQEYGTKDTSLSNNYKPEDLYEPESVLEEEAAQNQDSSDEAKSAKRKRKRSRWGEAEEGNPNNTATSPPMVPPGVSQLPLTVPPTCIQPSSNVILSKITRNDPALIQYAINTYGSTNISEEEWRKAEEHFKINLVYQDMLKKRQEVERLQKAGKHKYEYDSDEEIDGGTWEHKMRSKEMEATHQWATELNKQSEGKHHIGDFLPPEEYKKFLESCNAAKEGRQPDLSDYKECKIKEDNIGFKMLQKLGWSEGQGLGSEGTGIVEPINKAQFRDQNQGLGLSQPGGTDDEYDAYRKRMMLAYRFRPNPLNNPRRPYY